MKGFGIYGEDFIQLKSDIDLIKENIKRLLITVPKERVGNLYYGSRVREFLFNFEYILREDLEMTIVSAINAFEPRVKVLNIDIKRDEELVNKIYITLNLQLNENLEQFEYVLPIIF